MAASKQNTTGGITMIEHHKRATIALFAASAMLLVLAPTQASAQQQVVFAQDFNALVTSNGNNAVTVAGGTALYLPVSTDNINQSQNTYIKDFLGGVNTVTNNGYVFVGTEFGDTFGGAGVIKNIFVRDRTRYEGEMRMVNLTTFANNGDIYLGSFYNQTTGNLDFLVGTDRWHDDILSMEGADFVAGANSRIFLDANLNAAGQERCNAADRITTPVDGDNNSGSLPAADCLNLAGGSVSGRTLINVTDVWPGDRGVFNPDGNVLVDLTGGDPADPNAFVLDPDSANYDPVSGAIDKGLFAYALGYDPDLQQFRLYGVAAAGSHQLPLIAHAATDLWRTASGGWFERQVDQRDVERESGVGGGFWARVASATADRGVSATSQAGVATITFDNSYRQEDDAATFGLDLIAADGAGSSWVVGGMIGYARSRVDFNNYDNQANLEGMHAGLYGGFTAGDFFVDAAVNGTWLDLDSAIGSLNLLPAGTDLATKVSSLGGQVEAGWRFGRERISIEPLAGLTWVSTTVEDVDVLAADPGLLGAVVEFEDTVSLRASLGARLTVADFVPLTPHTRLSLTARHSQEMDGEAAATVVNPGPADALVTDTFEGAFSEISAAFSVANESETVAGYLRFGAVFGDDYDNVGGSAGVRFQW